MSIISSLLKTINLSVFALNYIRYGDGHIQDHCYIIFYFESIIYQADIMLH